MTTTKHKLLLGKNIDELNYLKACFDRWWLYRFIWKNDLAILTEDGIIKLFENVMRGFAVPNLLNMRPDKVVLIHESMLDMDPMLLIKGIELLNEFPTMLSWRMNYYWMAHPTQRTVYMYDYEDEIEKKARWIDLMANNPDTVAITMSDDAIYRLLSETIDEWDERVKICLHKTID